MSDENPSPEATSARRTMRVWAAVLIALTVLSGVWSFSPARELLDPREWLALLNSFSDHSAAPWAVGAGFLAGSLLVLPVTIMVVLTVAAFGPVEGFCYALGGTTAAGLMSFAIGRCLGRRQLDRLAGTRLHRVSLKLRSAGITTIAAVRLIPLTHFTVVSLVAGVSHIRIRDFIAGTVLGMAPGIAAIAIFFDQLSAAARSPSMEHLLWLAAISLVIAGSMLYFRRTARPQR